MKIIRLTDSLTFAISDRGEAAVLKQDEPLIVGEGRSLWTAAKNAGRQFWETQPLELGGITLSGALSAVRAHLAGAVLEEDSSEFTRALIVGAAAACGCKGWRTKDDYHQWCELLDARIEIVNRLCQQQKQLGPIGRPGKRYSVILADPPWDYNDNGMRLSAQFQGHYSYMSLREICNLGPMIRDCTAKDAVLLLWITNTALIEGRHLPLCEAWGFTPKTLVPWVKVAKGGDGVAIGGGHYSRAVSEELHIAARGKLDVYAEDSRIILSARGKAAGSVVKDRSVPGLILSPRETKQEDRSVHSAKPDAAYLFAEQLLHPPYLELFARKGRPGWDSWGDQA